MNECVNCRGSRQHWIMKRYTDDVMEIGFHFWSTDNVLEGFK